MQFCGNNVDCKSNFLSFQELMISFDIERDLYKRNIIMIGVDEAGRGHGLVHL